jgi:hypothetical protein
MDATNEVPINDDEGNELPRSPEASSKQDELEYRHWEDDGGNNLD